MEELEDRNITTVGEPAEIEGCREELRKAQQRYVRVLADFSNYRRRMERESARKTHNGNRGIILSLLEVVDDFDRALQHAVDAPPALTEGLHAVQRKLRGVLEAQGVTPFQSVGKIFDPGVHEAIASVSSDQHEQGVVVEEVRRGYRWNGELLRPARVVVAR
jgi:molecular chaperone GrpE